MTVESSDPKTLILFRIIQIINFINNRFTQHRDHRVEQLVQDHLDIIVNAVIRHISPRAIILAGSFGRGEGCATIENNQVRILSDYEIGIVTSKAWKRTSITRLSGTLSKDLDADVSLFWVTPSRLKHNRMKNFSWGNSPPTIFAYDLRAGSIVLYGTQYLKDNRIQSNDLPPWEGLRLLFNRLGELLFQLDCGQFRGWVCNQDDGVNLPLAKPLLSAVDGLVVASGDYVSSAEERLKLFLESGKYQQPSHELANRLQNALNHRIRGDSWQGIPWELFRAFMIEALQTLVEKSFQLEFQAIEDFPSNFRPPPKILSYVVQYHPGWLPVSPIWFEIFMQKHKLKRAGLGSHIKMLTNQGMIPSLTLFSMIPGMILLGNDQSPGTIINGIRQTIPSIDKISSVETDEWDRWEAVRQFMRSIWKTIY